MSKLKKNTVTVYNVMAEGLTDNLALVTLSATGHDSEPVNIPYILESNPHPFYCFRGLKNQTRITIACGLDSRSRAGFWKNDGAAVRAVRTIQYNNLLFVRFVVITHN